MVPHPIPYQGSKRRLAPAILDFIPSGVGTLYEPCCGSAAITLAAAHTERAARFVIGDSFGPLTRLWSRIVSRPRDLSLQYKDLWESQQSDPRSYYDLVRDEFNKDKDPGKLLYLLARCVKNSVRFNSQGDFNQSPDNRRLGAHPERMDLNILAASALLRGKSLIKNADYAETLDEVKKRDLVYFDPPYQGTSEGKDQRYHQNLDRERFVKDIESLLRREIRVIISFDGRCGNRTYGTDLPTCLGLVKIEVYAGRSTQSTLNGRSDETYESLYVSPCLVSVGKHSASNFSQIQRGAQKIFVLQQPT